MKPSKFPIYYLAHGFRLGGFNTNLLNSCSLLFFYVATIKYELQKYFLLKVPKWE